MALYISENIDKWTLFGIWKIEESEKELRKELLLKSHFGERWNNLSIEKRRIEFLCARIIVKHLLGKEVAINYTNNGAPFLGNGWNISISHSKLLVAVIVSKIRGIAIDVEQICGKTTRLQNRFLMYSEQMLLQYNNISNDYGTTLLWSAKESIYKISRSPMRVHYKDRILVKAIYENHMIGLVVPDEEYTIYSRTIDNYVLTYIIN